MHVDGRWFSVTMNVEWSKAAAELKFEFANFMLCNSWSSSETRDVLISRIRKSLDFCSEIELHNCQCKTTIVIKHMNMKYQTSPLFCLNLVICWWI